MQAVTRVNRLLQMMLLLQGSRSWTSEELALRFEVSKRTIFRDVELLRKSGIPISTDDSAGGYQLLAGNLQFTQLAPCELIALVLADRGMSSANWELFRKSREMAVAKLMSGVTPRLQSQVRLVLKKLNDLSDNPLLEISDERTMAALIDSWSEPPKQAVPG